MKKIAGEVIAGLVLISASIYLLYLFLNQLNQTANFLFLAGAVILGGGGVFSLYLASKAELNNSSEKTTVNSNGMASKLERNNQIVSEWQKTIEQKDKLRMLEIAQNEKAA